MGAGIPDDRLICSLPIETGACDRAWQWLTQPLKKDFFRTTKILKKSFLMMPAICFT
jgi:molybdopterin biosynthesis enzyme MoaB